MRILMLGTMVPNETKEFCFKMGQRTSAADSVQDYMLHGLEIIDEIDRIDSIGSARIQFWPRSRIKRLCNSEEKLHKGKAIGVGYFNLPFLAFLLREKAIVQTVKEWALKNKNGSNIAVIIYSMHSPFLKAAKVIKTIIPNAKIVLTVADLPLFMNMRGLFRRTLKKLDWYRITRLLRCVDKYLLYTKYMADYLKLEKEKWMVFEGIIDENRVIKDKQNKSAERYALYAGNLDSRYGIDLLIEAFSKLPNKEKLYIYGAGFDKERISSLIKPLPNVEYKGQVTPDEIFEIMKQATILINPRPSEIGLAKYSCPSKTFEYLASGTPVIMNKLPGVPDEYLKYVFLFPSETAEGYAKAISDVFAKSDEELQQFGMRGASFLRENKTSVLIMKKVYDFINR